MRTDLHAHTYASDGSLSPTKLVELAHVRDVRVLAITDHDTDAGCAEATQTGNTLGVRIICGIEVSALSEEGKEVHVLGYGIAPTDLATRTKLASLRGVREHRAQALLKKLSALNIHISFARVRELAGDGMIGRPHVARAMLEMGAVQSFNQAFDDYLGEGKSAFVPHEGLNPAQAIALIHAAHGCAVLAHPAFYKGNLEGLLASMVADGLDGIEAFYPVHTPEQTQAYRAVATNHGLVLTGGSDFHNIIADNEVWLGTVALPKGAIENLDARIARY